MSNDTEDSKSIHVQQSPPSNIDGVKLADEIEEFVARFIVLPNEHALPSVVLWVLHTHFMEHWEQTPRLAVMSPFPACGKTRLLEVIGTLVSNPYRLFTASAAYAARKIDESTTPPTLIVDEIDSVFGPAAKPNEAFRSFINAGNRKGVKYGRCNDRQNGFRPEEYGSYCAIAMGGLGDLPDTVSSRSIILNMRPKQVNEQVDQWRYRNEAEGKALRKKIEQWAQQEIQRNLDSAPDLPSELRDRPADNWEPMIQVADLLKGDWPTRGRDAAVAYVADSETRRPNPLQKVLRGTYLYFSQNSGDRVLTSDLISFLNEDPTLGWCETDFEPLNSYSLAKFLRPVLIFPKDLRIKNENRRGKGYLKSDFVPVWRDYLPEFRDIRDKRDGIKD